MKMDFAKVKGWLAGVREFGQGYDVMSFYLF